MRSWNIVCAPATPYLESQQNDSDAPAVEMPAADDNQSAVDSGSARLKDSVDKLEVTRDENALLLDNMQEMSAAEYAVTLISLFTLPTPFSIFGFFLEILV